MAITKFASCSSCGSGMTLSSPSGGLLSGDRSLTLHVYEETLNALLSQQAQAHPGLCC